MPNLIKHTSGSENCIKPLLEASNTKFWKDALDILFISGHVISYSSSPFNFPCLVSIKGPYDRIDPSIDLLEGKSIVKIAPLISSIIQIFLPKIMVIAKREEFKGDSGEKEEFSMAMMMMAEFVPELEKYQKELASIMIQGTSSLSDLIIIQTLRSLLDTRDKHLHCTFGEEKYENMIISLRRLGLIEEKIQVSLCPECANYEFSISKGGSEKKFCPKCGHNWVTGILYTFENSFGDIKIDNSDLPIFISGYLRHKINCGCLFRKIDVYSNASYQLENNADVEVDVHIPEFNFGIECKVYEDIYAPMTESRIGNLVGKLMPQIKRYEKLGIEKILIVTNLIENSTGQLQDALYKSLKKEKCSATVKILPGDPDTLLDNLNEISSKIINSINSKYSERYLAQDEDLPQRDLPQSGAKVLGDLQL